MQQCKNVYRIGWLFSSCWLPWAASSRLLTNESRCVIFCLSPISERTFCTKTLTDAVWRMDLVVSLWHFAQQTLMWVVVFIRCDNYCISVNVSVNYHICTLLAVVTFVDLMIIFSLMCNSNRVVLYLQPTQRSQSPVCVNHMRKYRNIHQHTCMQPL